MELFSDEGYDYIKGDKIHREHSEMLLTADIKSFWVTRYIKEQLTSSETDSIILSPANVKEEFVKLVKKSCYQNRFIGAVKCSLRWRYRKC